MTLPQTPLDERDFQSLVSEARTRIAQRCPEWTEHNVSDPGITLIEQFAHMTEQLIYRVNRIPERLHVALLDLLDVQLEPPIAASALLRFRLTRDAPLPVQIDANLTEVTTATATAEDAVVFQVAEDFTIPPLRLLTYAAGSRDQLRTIDATEGIVRPGARMGAPFGRPPLEGDAFYLGFDVPLAKLVVRLELDVSRAEGSGVEPGRPPLVWEASTGDTTWGRCDQITDTTGGLNTDGIVELQLPQATAEKRIDEHRRHWIRCRFTTTVPGSRPFTQSPVVISIAAQAVGAALTGLRAVRHGPEELGLSDGTAAQVFQLRHKPALELDDAREQLMVLEPGAKGPVAWERVDSFAKSKRRDRHFRFDPATGEIELGPRIRTREGWRDHGAVPAKGARLWLTQYREAAGAAGNVKKDTLTVMRRSSAHVASVTNPQAARDGAPVESVAAARERAALELRTQYRAVTAEDFEFLAGEASPNVARAHCAPPKPGERIVVSILPRLPEDPAGGEDADAGAAAERELKPEELVAHDELRACVRRQLDAVRVLGTSVHVAPVKLRRVTVAVNARLEPFAQGETVKPEIRRALFRFLNPHVGGVVDGRGKGWRFGRDVELADLFAVVRAVPGVARVELLRMYPHDRVTGARDPHQAGQRIPIDPDELACSGDHVVKCEAFHG